VRGADEAGGVRPKDFDEMYRIVCRMEEMLLSADAPRGFGHNDPVPQNFIAAPDRVYMVDFDYAGVTWNAVDLACTTSQAVMTDDEVERFLRAYDPDLDGGQRARVEVLRFVNTLREVAWAAMAEPILASKTTLMEGWSYQWHGETNLQLARALLQKRSFEALVSAAVKVRPGALF
jgi:thiamine kinase-like enzyme